MLLVTTWGRRVLLVGAAVIALTPTSMAQTTGSLAEPDYNARLAAIPCASFTQAAKFTDNFRFMRPTPNDPNGIAPFGVPYIEWTQQRFNALKARVRECGNPNIYGGSASSQSPTDHAMFYVESVATSVPYGVKDVRDARDRREAANAQTLAAIDSASKLPPREQIVALKRAQATAYDPALRERIEVQIERAQNLSAEQDQTNSRVAAADAAQQRLVEQQQAIEKARRDHDALQAEIAREKLAIEDQRKRTETARQQASDADARAAKLRQQADTLTPVQQEAEAQAKRDQEDLQRLRQQRADLEQQGKQANQQTATSQAEVQQAENERKLDDAATFLTQQNSGKLASMGFAPDLLDATMMVPDGRTQFQEFTSLREVLCVLLAEPANKIAPASGVGNTRRGFSVKRPNEPTQIFLFRKDGDELYLDTAGVGDTVEPLAGDAAVTANLNLLMSVRSILTQQAGLSAR